MLARLKQQQITILVSTPYMDEASLCDRIALMRGGQFLQIDTPEGIVAGFGRRLWAVRAERMPALLGDVRSWEGTESCFAFGDVHHLTLREGKHTASGLESFLAGKGHKNIAIREIPPTIEDCYMQLDNTERHD